MKNIKKNFIKISFVLVIIITIFSSLFLFKNIVRAESPVITEVSPTEGKEGELIIIKGVGLDRIKDVVFFDEKKASSIVDISETEIKVIIPPLAKTGEFVIIDENNYSVRSPFIFNVIENKDLFWWFSNENKQTVGSLGLHSTYGFNSVDSCKESRLEYLNTKKLKEGDVGSCIQKTRNEIVGIIQIEKDAELVGISGMPGTNIENKSTYTLLAPFLGLKCIDTSGTNPDCAKGGIGDYLNLIFNIAIALCGALAVIMIIIGGIEYMGEESVFSKGKAKTRITSALLGLVIALGSYAILNTINPDLLGKGGINLESVDIDIETQPLTYNDQIIEGMISSKCSEGIVTAQTENGAIPVCKRLEKDIKDLVSAANKDSVKLTGFGYRSTKRQEEFRRVNCGGEQNIYNEKAVCKPLTALPGRSNHEHGLAVDFRCDGIGIDSQTNKCFVWLSKYAEKYKYKNLEKEPWHWSIDGH